MKFSQMFQDDNTGQLSLGRVLSAVIVLFVLLCTGHIMVVNGVLSDIPTGWAALAAGLYGINKVVSSTTANIKGGDCGANQ